MVSASAHAKFILCGEHFVVHGGHCVAMPASCFSVRAIYEPSETFGVRCIFPPHAAAEFSQDELLGLEAQASDLVLRTMHMLGDSVDRLACTIQSDIPVGQGAGSSSALCHAIIEGLLRYRKWPESNAHYLEWLSRALENGWHGPVSGVDNAVVAHRVPMIFKDCIWRRLNVAAPFHFLVGSTGGRQEGKRGFVELRRLKKHEPSVYRRFMLASDDAALMAASALEAGDFNRLGDAFLLSQSVLARIHASTPKIDDAVRVAFELGAAAKLTGAGGGGFVIATARWGQLETLQKAWESIGVQSVRRLTLEPSHFG